MKYRIEIDIAFESEIDAQSLLNHIDDIKSSIYNPTGNETFPLYRKAEYGEELYDSSEMNIIESVNFEE